MRGVAPPNSHVVERSTINEKDFLPLLLNKKYVKIELILQDTYPFTLQDGPNRKQAAL